MTETVRRASFAVLLLLSACGGADRGARGASAFQVLEPPPPLQQAGDPYLAALQVNLVDKTPWEHPQLHNVYRLSERIICGGEPLGREGLEAVAEMGVHTILSVDGKAPDVAAAEALGMRYVHVPLRYSGMSADELLQIAKTFRELEGPFYVHCFHGKHRGPAAAAVGRLMVDRAPREQVLAEMRQWCGTSGKYHGLYGVAAYREIPATEETEAYAWDFPGVQRAKGLREAMIQAARISDSLELLGRGGWRSSTEHPDLDAGNEARKMVQVLQRCTELDEVRAGGEGFARRMEQNLETARSLAKLLEEGAASEPAGAGAADRSFTALREQCSACHAEYRNR